MNGPAPSMREHLDSVPSLGDVDQALDIGARRRARTRCARVTFAATVASTAVIAVIGLPTLILRNEDRPPIPPATELPVERMLTEPVEIDESIRDWVPESTLIGAPAPADVALAEQCSSPGDCSYLLVGPGEQRIELADVSPSLARLLSAVDAGDLSISYDAQWISIPTEKGLRLQSLDPDYDGLEPITLELETPDRHWELVAWGSGSLNASFAEFDRSGTPTRYAVVDLPSQTLETVPAPQPKKYLPVDHLGTGPVVAQPASGTEPSTEVETLVVDVVPDPSWDVGELMTVSDRPEDLSSLLSEDETLAGPNGSLETRTPPSSGDSVVWPRATVFRQSENGLERSGLIEVLGGAPTRLAYGDPLAGETLLGTTRPDSALRVTTDGDRSHLTAHGDSGPIWKHSLEGDIAWVVPGLAPS